MYSYVDKLEILGDPDRSNLEKRVIEFSAGKCIKDVTYQTNASAKYFTEKYFAYIKYSLPEPPTINLTGEIVGTDLYLTLALSSNIWLKLTQVGVYYNNNNRFSVRNDRVLFPNTYGTSTAIVTGINPALTYYAKPYIDICMGRMYGDVITLGATNYLTDTYGDPITDTYGAYITPL
jgi:hypothetical protein